MENGQEQQIELSIIIKTLNEERNIGRCIEAIISTLNDVVFEIIVADSGSSDRTVDIAANYPVIIVQLANPAERSCGIGPQLGYQHSRGQYVLILDADMVLHASFIRSALSRMKNDNRCGGIGGQLIERSGTGYEYESQQALTNVQEEAVNWLNGCALYRREAIASVGYLSNRNLHAYEEKELGLRLKYAGWHLYRLSDVAVDHYGHTDDTLKLLWRRWHSGYADACGESIRACIGKPYIFDMILVHKTQVACLIFQIGLFLTFLALPFYTYPFVFYCCLALSIFLVQAFRKKGLQRALYSFLYINVFAFGLAKGVFKQQISPVAPIKSTVKIGFGVLR